MHEEKTGAFLRSLCANVKTRPQVEYALGFLSHYAADTVVHPFIYAMCKPGCPYAGKGGHGYLEIALDSTLHADDVFTNVQNVFSASAGVTVTGPVAERTQWETMINGMMALLVGLIAVAVLIALVGVANTLSLSVIERTRESATLRAIGMTRGQLRRSLAVEALLLSLVSGVVGVVLGTLFGWLGSYMVFSLYGDTVFPFEWATNGVVLGVAALAALLASVAPARRAVKTPPVEALAAA